MSRSPMARMAAAKSSHQRPLTGGSGSRYVDAMARRDLIAEKLTKAFAPANLEVVDESHYCSTGLDLPAR